jgi:hypothetical protein
VNRFALAAVAVVAVVCLVGVSIAAVAAGGTSLAYEVNGSRVSQATIDGQLDELADAAATSQASNTDGSIDSRAAAQVLTLNIVRNVLEDAASRQGVEVTDETRDAARTNLESSMDGYPDSYRDLAVDVQATAIALGLEDSEALDAFLVEQFRTADVYVNPRYGRWSPRLGVCPPTGCVNANATAGG